MLHRNYSTLHKVVDEVVADVHMTHALALAHFSFRLQENCGFVILHNNVLGGDGALRLQKFLGPKDLANTIINTDQFFMFSQSWSGHAPR